MFKIIHVFSKTSLTIFLAKHPFIKKWIINRMKKFDITFEEMYYIHLSSRFHRNLWITERHLVPVINPDNGLLKVLVNNCPICTGEHLFKNDQINFLQENCPLLIQELRYIAKYANNYALQLYNQILKNGKSAEFASEEYNAAYLKMVEHLTHDTNRGKILMFPSRNCS